MPGRKPKPTRLKVIQGNPGKRRLPENEPKPAPVKRVAIPKSLDKDGRACWRQLFPVLQSTRVLTKADLKALENLCISQAIVLQCQREVAEHGVVVPGRLGEPVRNPALSPMNQAMSQVRAYQVEFGLTPSSRVKVKTVEEPKADKLAEYLKRGKKTR